MLVALRLFCKNNRDQLEIPCQSDKIIYQGLTMEERINFDFNEVLEQFRNGKILQVKMDF